MSGNMIRSKEKRFNKGLYWDEAWGLIEGCTPVKGGECDNCWKASETHMRSSQSNEKVKARYGGLTNVNGRYNGIARPIIQDLQKPVGKTPKVYSIWTDLFHKDVPMSFVMRVLDTVHKCPQHLFLCLTKRPDRMYEFFRNQYIPKNFACGTTAGVQRSMDERLPWILKIKAEHPDIKTFLSVEPLLEEVDMALDGTIPKSWGVGYRPVSDLLDLVIVGAESGKNRRLMETTWAVSAVNQCVSSSVPVYVKQVHMDGKVSKDPDMWPELLRIRQWMR